jgi:hypothetical protein
MMTSAGCTISGLTAVTRPERGKSWSSVFPVSEAATLFAQRATVLFYRSTSVNIADTFVDASPSFFFGDKEFYHSTLFVTHVTTRLHFAALLQ